MKINKLKFLNYFEQPKWLLFILVTTLYFFTKELFGISDFKIFYEAAENYKDGINPYIPYMVQGLNIFIAHFSL